MNKSKARKPSQGKPAGGKSTQCTRLLNQYGLVHVSAGDLLRSRQKVMPELANYMENGYLVPDDLVCSIVLERISMRDCANGVLLDGFPRTRHQAEMLRKSGVTVNHFLLLEVPDEVVIERIGGRRVDPVSGVTYHMKTNRPQDPAILKRLVQRKDDTKEKIEKRLVEYRKNIGMLLDFYSSVLSVIHATIHPDRVFDRIRQVIERDFYWGSSISRQLEVRNYETNNATLQDGSIDSQSISKYFEHLVYLMTTHGALGGVGQTELQQTRFVVRAQATEVSLALAPGLTIGSHVWLESIGTTSIVLGHTLVTTRRAIRRSMKQATATQTPFPECLRDAADNASDKTEPTVNENINGKTVAAATNGVGSDSPQNENQVIEIARGTTILVAISGVTSQVVEIPQSKWLRNLISQGAHGGVPTSLLDQSENISQEALAQGSRQPFLVLPLLDHGHLVEYTSQSSNPNPHAADRPRSLRLKAETAPADAFTHVLHIEPADVDRAGVLRTSACVRYFQSTRFIAGLNQGYEPGLRQRKDLGTTSRALGCSKPRYVWFEMISKAHVGEKLVLKTWVVDSTARYMSPIGDEGEVEQDKAASLSDLVLIGFQVMSGSRTLIRGCQGVHLPSACCKL